MRAASRYFKELLFLLGLFHCAGVIAEAQAPTTVTVEDAWVRLLPPSVKTTALYFTVTNHSDVEVEISEVVVDWAGRVELHETVDVDGMMHMAPLSDTRIAAGETVKFKPGGKHVMIMAINQPLQEMASMPVLLKYAVPSAAVSNPQAQQRMISFEALVKRE